jgi:hypothetical protein|tara:strand:+ start:236 stop:589 length:354 start_codon:yes stop_codon:yes gene_type:complete
MNELTAKTDLEIEVMIGKKTCSIKNGKTMDYYNRYCPKYCSSWAAIGPIIEDNKISLINIKNSTAWLACVNLEFENICLSPDGNDNGITSVYMEYEIHSTNPLRAACEVYLMLKVNK